VVMISTLMCIKNNHLFGCSYGWVGVGGGLTSPFKKSFFNIFNFIIYLVGFVGMEDWDKNPYLNSSIKTT